MCLIINKLFVAYNSLFRGFQDTVTHKQLAHCHNNSSALKGYWNACLSSERTCGIRLFVNVRCSQASYQTLHIRHKWAWIFPVRLRKKIKTGDDFKPYRNNTSFKFLVPSWGPSRLKPQLTQFPHSIGHMLGCTDAIGSHWSPKQLGLKLNFCFKKLSPSWIYFVCYLIVKAVPVVWYPTGRLAWNKVQPRWQKPSPFHSLKCAHFWLTRPDTQESDK